MGTVAKTHEEPSEQSFVAIRSLDSLMPNETIIEYSIGGFAIKTTAHTPYRKSRIRIGLLNYLQLANHHPSVAEVHQSLKKSYPQVSFSTVYRNLNILVHQGAIKRIESSRSQDRFDGRLDFHAHFHCDSCGELRDIDLTLEGVVNEIESRSGNKISGLQADFFGVCASCIAENKKEGS